MKNGAPGGQRAQRPRSAGIARRPRTWRGAQLQRSGDYDAVGVVTQWALCHSGDCDAVGVVTTAACCCWLLAEDFPASGGLLREPELEPPVPWPRIALSHALL